MKVDGNAVDTALSYTITNVQKATTITAEFSPISYTISYNGNGATSGTTSSSTHTYNVAKSLTTNGFSRTGYTFLGWSTSSTATSATYTDGQSVSNLTTTNGTTITLYAVWKVVDTITLSTPTEKSVDTDNLSISVRGTLKSGSGNITYKLYVGGSYKASTTGTSGSYVTLSATGLEEYTDYSCYVVATKSEDTSVTATSSSVSIKTYCSGTGECDGPRSYYNLTCEMCLGFIGYRANGINWTSGYRCSTVGCNNRDASHITCDCGALDYYYCNSCGVHKLLSISNHSGCGISFCPSGNGCIYTCNANGKEQWLCKHGESTSHTCTQCEHGYSYKHN